MKRKKFYVLTSEQMRNIEEQIERLNDKLAVASVIIENKNAEIHELKRNI